MMVRINGLPDKKIKDICCNIFNNNSFFAHGENVFVSMLGDSDESIRKKAVNIIQILRENGEQVLEEDLKEVNNDVEVSDEMIESSSNIIQYPPMDKSVRVFKKPIISFKASSYHEMTPSSQWRTQPPVLKEYNNTFIRSLEQIPLRLDFECHSQNIANQVN